MRSISRTALTAAILALFTAACHKPQPQVVAPVRAPNADSIAAANAARAAARAEAARRDSVARADAARRDAAARADAARRAAAEAEAARNSLTAAIYFDFDRDEMRADAMAALDAKVPLLNAHPDLKIRVAGNADDRGSDEYNLALGQRRAAAARRYLVARGIAETRIDVVSFGEQRPACPDDTEPCWQRNRRDEFVITAGTMAAREQYPRRQQR